MPPSVSILLMTIGLGLVFLHKRIAKTIYNFQQKHWTERWYQKWNLINGMGITTVATLVSILFLKYGSTGPTSPVDLVPFILFLLGVLIIIFRERLGTYYYKRQQKYYTERLFRLIYSMLGLCLLLLGATNLIILLIYKNL